MKTEVAKGKNADDSVVAKLIDGLVALQLRMSHFGGNGDIRIPVLSGLVGPATKYVLDKIQGK